MAEQNNSEAAGGDSRSEVEALVWEELRKCYDPEIPLNIVDLGLVYGVAVQDGQANVKMTLTSAGLPSWRPDRRECAGTDPVTGFDPGGERGTGLGPAWAPEHD